MWKFLFDIYVVRPRKKNKGKFSAFYYMVFLFGSLTFLQHDKILNPAPELFEIDRVEGVLVKVVNATGGRLGSVSVIVETSDKKQLKSVVGNTKEDAKLYQRYLGKPIKIWYRSLMEFDNAAVQIVLDGKMVREYSKATELSIHHFALIPFYITKILLAIALIKPWLDLAIRRLKSRG